MDKLKIFKILRMVFCALTVAVVAAAIFIFVYFGWGWGLVAIASAFALGSLMALFKKLQIEQENIINPPVPKGDFITGRVASKPEENTETENNGQ